MTELCTVPANGTPFLAGILHYVDCQAQTIGSSGYQALANPASGISLALTALLTIFIAIFGIRMLLGWASNFGEVISAIIKIGIVLTLSSSWAAYRVVAYDTVLRGPAEVVEAVGSSSSLPGARGGLVERLQGVDDAINAFIRLGTGRFDIVSTPPITPLASVPSHATPISDDVALAFARILYLAGTIGALAFVRLVGGLFLALAPLFAGFLLFEATRSFFMGWLRMLIGIALSAVGVTFILGVELAILEPWLANILAQRSANIMTVAAPLELLVMALAFATLLIGVIAICVRVTFVSQTLPWLRDSVSRLSQAWGTSFPVTQGRMLGEPQSAAYVSRAFGVAEAITSMQRRESILMNNQNNSQSQGTSSTRTPQGRYEPGVQPLVPIGQSYRRTKGRISSSTAQRGLRA